MKAHVKYFNKEAKEINRICKKIVDTQIKNIDKQIAELENEKVRLLKKYKILELITLK